MSHIGTAMLNSGVTNFKTTKLQGSMTKSKQIKQKNFTKNQSSNRSANKNEEEIWSVNDKILRTPKQIITQEYLVVSQYKYNLIEEIIREKEKLNVRPVIITGKLDKDIIRHRDISQDKSTESNKLLTDSMVDKKSVDHNESGSESSELKRNTTSKQNIDTAKKADNNLEESVDIILEETEINILFDIPSFTVNNENKELYDFNIERQKYYEDLVKKKIGSDNYNTKYNQTIDNLKKAVYCQTDIIDLEHKYCQNYEFKINKEVEEGDKEYDEKVNDYKKEKAEAEFDEKLKSPFTLIPTDLDSIKITQLSLKENYYQRENLVKQEKKDIADTKNIKGTTANIYQTKRQAYTKYYNTKNIITDDQVNVYEETQNIIKTQKKDFLDNINKDYEDLTLTPHELFLKKSESFKKSLKWVNKILNQNKHTEEFLELKNYPYINIKQAKKNNNYLHNIIGDNNATDNPDDNDSDDKKNKILKKILTYKDEIGSKNSPVVDSTWNTYNNDLFASCYNLGDNKGIINFWALNSPNCPERTIKLNNTANSISFSKYNPNLLAAGFKGGELAIYDCRSKSNNPILTSFDLDNKHLDDIFELEWIDKGLNKGESLVSIGGDCKVFEWNIKKGLESAELKLINKVSNGDNNKDDINFRNTAGFSFDFLKSDPNTYFISTEFGTVHRCSKSYKDNYLDSYFYHNGPVYKVRSNPFCSDIFLTCSADFYVRLFSVKEDIPKITLKSIDLNDEVNDIEWSNFCSTMFTSCARDGRIELWDLNKRSMDPIYIEREEASTNIVRFHLKDQILKSGNSNGDINIYRIYGYEDYLDLCPNQEELLTTIISSKNANKE